MASLNLAGAAARAAGEAAEKAQDAARPGPDVVEQMEHLANVERKTGRSGAVSRTPKQMMLDARDIESKNPTRHFRWVNVASTDKAMNSTLNGYSQWLEDGKPVTRGNLQLWSCPREDFEERKADREEATLASLDLDPQGRRNDSGQFYGEVEKVSALVSSRGHRFSKPEHIIKAGLDGVNL